MRRLSFVPAVLLGLLYFIGDVSAQAPAVGEKTQGTGTVSKEGYDLPGIESLGLDFSKPETEKPGPKRQDAAKKPSGPVRPLIQIPELPPYSAPGLAPNPLLPPINDGPGIWRSLIPSLRPRFPMSPPTMGTLQLAPENFLLPDLPGLGMTLPSPVVSGPRIKVTAFRYDGNTVFSDRELDKVTKPFLEKGELSGEDLEAVRAALTNYYLSHDYITSGAVLPDQKVDSGLIEYKIVEGKVARIEWTNRAHMREGYLNNQLAAATHGVLNMGALRQELQLLQRNPNISRIQAVVKPDLRPGEACLQVDAAPKGGFSAGLDANNHRTPSVGAEQIEAWVAHSNLFGWSDAIELRAGLLQYTSSDPKFNVGADFAAQYAIELPWWRTQLGLLWQSNSYNVIEEPFTQLNIDGKSEIARASIAWSLHRSLESQFTTGFFLDYRHGQSDVLGEPFSLTPGSVDGETEMWIARWFQEYVRRSRKQVFALRNTFSLGFAGTDDGTDRNAEFFSWNVLGQWVRRIGEGDTQLIVRGGGQWSNSPLLALEEVSIGGYNTVRGYIENQLVRDWGGFASVELRIPLWQSKRGNFSVFAAPFVDAGGGWRLEDRDGKWQPGEFDWIASAGAGLLLHLTRHVNAQVYWGYPLRERPHVSGSDLQYSGVSFNLQVTFF